MRKNYIPAKTLKKLTRESDEDWSDTRIITLWLNVGFHLQMSDHQLIILS